VIIASPRKEGSSDVNDIMYRNGRDMSSTLAAIFFFSSTGNHSYSAYLFLPLAQLLDLHLVVLARPVNARPLPVRSPHPGVPSGEASGVCRPAVARMPSFPRGEGSRPGRHAPAEESFAESETKRFFNSIIGQGIGHQGLSA
jgi:hypothetical protein